MFIAPGRLLTPRFRVLYALLRVKQCANHFSRPPRKLTSFPRKESNSRSGHVRVRQPAPRSPSGSRDRNKSRLAVASQSNFLIPSTRGKQTPVSPDLNKLDALERRAPGRVKCRALFSFEKNEFDG